MQTEITEGRLFRVELHLLTHLWNEGFERAEQPWLRIYTDNEEWIRGLPKSYTTPTPGSWINQDFRVQVDELSTNQAPPTQAELDEEDWDLESQEEESARSSRFFALRKGLSTGELNRILEQRLREWDGI